MRELTFDCPARCVHSHHLIQPVIIISILSMGRVTFREIRHDDAQPARGLDLELRIHVSFLYASCSLTILETRGSNTGLGSGDGFWCFIQLNEQTSFDFSFLSRAGQSLRVFPVLVPPDSLYAFRL